MNEEKEEVKKYSIDIIGAKNLRNFSEGNY